jgi:glucan phosphorylase
MTPWLGRLVENTGALTQLSRYNILQVSIDAMFDVQVKRVHEYKRQFLNVLGIIHRYDCIKVILLPILLNILLSGVTKVANSGS